MIAYFYHAYCDGAWELPTEEFLGAIGDGPLVVGLVGSPESRARAREAFAGRRAGIFETGAGWEQWTLYLVRAWASTHDGAVLYAHTKGATEPNAFNDAWRRSMLYRLVPTDVRALEHYDAIGSHWLTPERYPEGPNRVDQPYFGGNFWLARCDYLRRLPVCSTRNRHEAEVWIGRGAPRVLDLNPGWPDLSLFCV